MACIWHSTYLILLPNGYTALEPIQISSTTQDAASIHKTSSVLSVYYNERPSSLLSILQTEIELQPLLRLYLEQVRQRLSLDGLILHWQEQQYAIGIVNSSYRLTMEWTIDDHSHVKLVYVSSHRFNAQVHQQLDWLQRQLHFPLRNALRYETMRQHSRTDHLTGLGNRSSFEEQASNYIAQAKRSQQKIAVIILDLNHFKQVNDNHGHMTGDRILKAAAQSLQESTRESDLTFRLGGDEYAVLLTHCSNGSCTAVEKRIEHHFRQNKLLTEFGVTASLGTAEWVDTDTFNTWLHRADKNMYAAKRIYHQAKYPV